jgi:hypothetical protein
MFPGRSHSYRIIGIILLFGVIVTGCSRIFPTPIGRILENPRDYSEKTVVVSGEVTEVFGFFGIKYFVVKDKTGEITVVTRKPLPRRGTSIKIRGTVKEAFVIGDNQVMVIVEEGEK